MNYNSDNSGLELSKKVHGLLDHIRNLQYKDESNEEYANQTEHNRAFIADKSIEVMNESELILIDDIDFSDDETWLSSLKDANTRCIKTDLNDWLKVNAKQDQGDQSTSESKKFIDTRTFTRQKKRISRPSLENMEFFMPNHSRLSLSNHSEISNNSYDSLLSRLNGTGIFDNSSKLCVTTEEQFSNIEDISVHNLAHSSNAIEKDNNTLAEPLHFKLSEPVLNNTFDRILMIGKECIDSFQNMSPPSLMNSLCSSTFTTLNDSAYLNNLDQMSNELNDSSFQLPPEISQEIENLNQITRSYQDSNIESQKPNILTDSLDVTFDMNKRSFKCDNLDTKYNIDPNITFNKNDLSVTNDENVSKTPMNAFSNATFSRSNKTIKDESKNITKPENLNFTYPKPLESSNTMKNITNTNTFIRKNKADYTYNNLKSSCPDINKTFQKRTEETLNKTFQKLSDSQPNLLGIQQTILNQTIDLMNPTEMFHNPKSGSTDSLDERSSSISNSSKGSGSRIMNMSDLDHLARLQEQSLQQVMSTPKQKSNHSLLWGGDVPSPINNLVDEDYLSDSDSDVCLTARREFPQHIISQNYPAKLPKEKNNSTDLNQPSHRTVPTMIVKPMEVKQNTVQNDRVQSAQTIARPRFRGSGLPRPTSATGIPRPVSRIPGPKSIRPQLVRPTQRQLPKSNWMDGCY